jgi:prevent-host-death family protein
MRSVQASEAKTHLPALLDEVERGETVVITRHGRAVARLVPEPERREEEVACALQAIQEIGRRTTPVGLDDLLASRHEGHRY